MKGKIALVTGGTSGIGLATAEKMAKEGAIVYACARNKHEFSLPNMFIIILMLRMLSHVKGFLMMLLRNMERLMF